MEEKYMKATEKIGHLEKLCRDLLMLAVAGASTSYDRAKWHRELEKIAERMDKLGVME